jgi:PAS domain-containing protein
MDHSDRTDQARSQKLLPAVIALDENQVITHWSHGAESLFGVTRAVAVGASAERLDGWHVDPATLRSYADLKAGEVRSFHSQVVTRRGVHLTMNSLASAGLDARGRKEVLIRFCLTPAAGRPSTDWLEPSSEVEWAAGDTGIDGHQHHLPSPRRILARMRSHT